MSDIFPDHYSISEAKVGNKWAPVPDRKFRGRKMKAKYSRSEKTDTPGAGVFSQGLYVEFHTKGIFDMELEI